MRVSEVTATAYKLFEQYGLNDWVFQTDNAVKRFGRCSYSTRTISMSRQLIELNNETEVMDTLLHEIAHALTKGAGHGKRWKEKCIEIGARPNAQYEAAEVARPKPVYVADCNCSYPHEKFRKPSAAIRWCRVTKQLLVYKKVKE